MSKLFKRFSLIIMLIILLVVTIYFVLLDNNHSHYFLNKQFKEKSQVDSVRISDLDKYIVRINNRTHILNEKLNLISNNQRHQNIILIILLGVMIINLIFSLIFVILHRSANNSIQEMNQLMNNKMK